MPATPSRISFITVELRTAKIGPVQSVVDAYGSNARSTVEPLETFFDHIDDVRFAAQRRFDLLSENRRRFEMSIDGEATGIGLSYDMVTPTANVIDIEKNADFNGAVVDITIDLGTNETILNIWG